MASGGENEFGEDKEEDKRRYRDKKRKKEESNSTSESEREEETYVVGMRPEVKADCIFGDPHEVGKFVERKVGKVKSVRVTRGGTVIIDCKDHVQSYRAINICSFGDIPVHTFHLGGEGNRRKKGIISGVPMTVNPEIFVQEVEGVCEAKRLSRYKEGMREDTKSKYV